jgi:hypothetical protein
MTEEKKSTFTDILYTYDLIIIKFWYIKNIE